MVDDLREKLELERARLEGRERLQQQREASAKERLLISQQLREQSRHLAEQLGIEQDREMVQLKHELDKENRELDFDDAIRYENLKLQSLATELSIRDPHLQRDNKRRIQEIVALAQAEIIKLAAEGHLKQQQTKLEQAHEKEMELIRGQQKEAEALMRIQELVVEAEHRLRQTDVEQKHEKALEGIKARQERKRMTHATDEQMRLEVFRMELKRRYHDLTDEEILAILQRGKSGYKTD